MASYAFMVAIGVAVWLGVHIYETREREQQDAFETNMPFGLVARTSGDQIRVLQIVTAADGTKSTRDFVTATTRAWIATVVGDQKLEVMAPYKIRLDGEVFDTRDGPQMVMKDEAWIEHYRKPAP